MGIFNPKTGRNIFVPGMTAKQFAEAAALPKNQDADMASSLTAIAKERPGVVGEFLALYLDEPEREEMTPENSPALLCFTLLLCDRNFPTEERENHLRAVLPRITAMITDQTIRDDQMLTLAGVLATAGHPLPDELMNRSFRDWDGTLQKHLKKHSRNLADDPESITMLMERHGLYSFMDDCTPSVDEINNVLVPLLAMAETTPAAVVPAATCLAIRAEQPDLNIDGIREIYARMRELGTPRALWCLEALADWPGLGVVRPPALDEANKLRQTGIAAEPPALKGEFSSARVSMTDDSGSRYLLVFWKRTKREMDAVSIMLNDIVGIKNVMFVFGEGKEFGKELAAGPGQEMTWADISRDMAKALFADALACHLDSGAAPPGIVFSVLPYFGDTPPAPKHREPNLDAYNLDAIAPTPDLAGPETVDLLDSPVLLSLVPIPETAYAFCRDHHPGPEKPLPEGDCNAFIEQVLAPEQSRLLHRMAVNLEVEALAGRAKRRENRKAAELWLGLRENVVPFAQHPFIRELAIESSNSILEDIDNGFTTRQAALESELNNLAESPGGLLNELFNDPEFRDIPPEAMGSFLSDLFGTGDAAPPIPSQAPEKKKGKGSGKKGKGRKDG